MTDQPKESDLKELLSKKTDVTDDDIDKLMKVFREMNACNIWSRVEREDFVVRRFEFGYVNNIIGCELTDDARKRLCRSPNDPSGVVVKFPPVMMFFALNRVDVATNHAIISAHGLSPKLLHIDDTCMVHELVKGRNYNQEDDLDEETVAKLARMLARFHSLRSPTSCNGFKQWQKMMENMDDAPTKKDMDEKKFLKLIAADEELKEQYYSVFENADPIADMQYAKKLTEACKSPIVFSHTDFNRGNRLVKHCPKSGKKEIYFIDFDYTTYNYRGIDFGRYFSNFGHLDDMFGDEGFPTDAEMRPFLDEYRRECALACGDHYLVDEQNSFEQLVRETKAFVLSAYSLDYYFCLMLYCMNPTGVKKRYNLDSARNRLYAFQKAKQRFIDDGTIAQILQDN